MSHSTPTAELVANWTPEEALFVFGQLMIRFREHNRSYKSPRADSIRALAIGESLTIPGWTTTTNLHQLKKTARRLAGDDTLDWVARTTNKGIKVIRVS